MLKNILIFKRGEKLRKTKENNSIEIQRREDIKKQTLET